MRTPKSGPAERRDRAPSGALAADPRSRQACRMARARALALPAAALLTGVTCLAPAAPGAAGQPAAITITSGACPVPLVHDTSNGFHVGVPSGWELSTLRGEIAITANASGTEGVILYPALLTKGVTAAGVFDSFMRFEQQLVRKGGGSFSYRSRTGAGGLLTASLTAVTGGASLEGAATVRVLALQTQLASREAVVSVYWAPRSQYPAVAGLLSGIGRCYAPERASLFSVFKDQVFTYMMPPGWHPGVENANALEIENAGNTASATFYLFGPYVQGVNINQRVDSPQTAINYIFSQVLGIQVTQRLSTTVVPNKQSGVSTIGQEYMEFTGRLSGKLLHGVVYVITSTGGSSTAGTMRLALAQSPLWNSLNGVLIQMAGFIQHDFTQDLIDIEQVNRQWQDFSGQVSNFDDVLNSQQLVKDPSSGQYYEAPYSSYIANGPDGPGYYLPNGQRLNPVQRL